MCFVSVWVAGADFIVRDDLIIKVSDVEISIWTEFDIDRAKPVIF